MTACERSGTLFGRAWDDELTAAERDALEVHFTACPACRREYDELARTLELVQALPRPQVDDAFAMRVLTAARAREAEAASAPRRWFAPPAAWIPGPAFGRPALALAATFVIALGIGAFLLSRPVPGPSPVAVEALPAPVLATGPEALPPAGPVPGPALATTPAPRPIVASPPATEPAPRVAARRAATEPALAASAIPDSLFDHSADVELVLDPVQLRRERGRGYTPASPTVRGEAASITF